MPARPARSTKSRLRTQRRILISIGVILASCCACLGGVAILNITGVLNTPTPVIEVDNAATNAVIEALIASTQTADAQIPITGSTSTQASLSTETSTSTITNTPTLIATALPSQTSTTTATPRPTFTLRPSNTPYIPASGGGNSGNCDPSYPGVCIPPRPPDLDCPQIPYTDFTVLAPDPHGFDRDGDGIGCES